MSDLVWHCLAVMSRQPLLTAHLSSRAGTGKERSFSQMGGNAKRANSSPFTPKRHNDPQPSTSLSPPMAKVFISYSHDSPLHKRRIHSLATQLRTHQLEVIIDQDKLPGGPDEGWDHGGTQIHH